MPNLETKEKKIIKWQDECTFFILVLHINKQRLQIHIKGLVNMGAMGALAPAILRKGYFRSSNFEEKILETNRTRNIKILRRSLLIDEVQKIENSSCKLKQSV